ncbi:MAG: trypsin-like serine protease, partial [Rubripirellula sp.]
MERTHKRFKLRSSLSPSTSRSLQVQPLEERRLMAADLGNDEGLLAEGEAPRAAEVSSQLHFDSSELVFNDMPERRIVNGQETAEFDAVGIVNNGCTGTLISPTHVLTAAHCTVGATPQQMSFQVGGETYQVSAEFTHPQYNDAQFDAGWDLAIMELDRPVEGVEPMQIMRAQPEIGETLTIVGFGEGGTDTGGSSFDFGTKRVGTTPLEEVTENHLWWTFDA